MRQSSFQRIDIPLSRDIESKYDDIKVVADNIDAVVTSNGAIDTFIDILDNISSILTVAGISGDVTTVAGISSDVTAVATTVVPNIAEILLADDNAAIATAQAGIATTKASEASASAVVASAYANINWAGFSVVDGELIVTYASGLTSTPSIVDGDFIITY